ncbi:hypothetical protein ABTH30_24365, partial [Acinetobacter baumannii]
MLGPCNQAGPCSGIQNPRYACRDRPLDAWAHDEGAAWRMPKPGGATGQCVRCTTGATTAAPSLCARVETACARGR